MKLKSILTIITFFSIIGISNAQVGQKNSIENLLARLVKAEEGDLNLSKHLRLDQANIAVYFEMGY
jgi:hypothetical protein